jgi:LacI family transcriptional regulator
MSGMTVRIDDVAQKCGLSIATVSRALDGAKSVSRSSRDKVLQAVAELNYTPNELARGLARNKSNIIGIVVSDISTFFSSTILSTIEKQATQAGHSLMVCNILEDLEKEKKYIRTFEQMRVQGIILMHEGMDSELLQMLEHIKVPIVCSSVRLKQMNISCVIVDDEQATYDAVTYLISMGHKRIAYFGFISENTSIGRTRYDGYRRALQESGIVIDKDLIFTGGMDLENGYQFMHELVNRRNSATAVFSGSDDLAIGALSCANDIGVKIPEEISIVGFDNSKITPFIRPALTTVSQSFEDLGIRTIELLEEHIQNPHKEPIEIIIPHFLQIRQSCCKPK